MKCSAQIGRHTRLPVKMERIKIIHIKVLMTNMEAGAPSIQRQALFPLNMPNVLSSQASTQDDMDTSNDKVPKLS